MKNLLKEKEKEKVWEPDRRGTDDVESWMDIIMNMAQAGRRALDKTGDAKHVRWRFRFREIPSQAPRRSGKVV